MADLLDKIDTLKLKEILEEKEMKFTKGDIICLMDAELEKAPAEMNTNLVDLCVAVLESNAVPNEAPNKPKPAKRKIKVGKILLVAAVIALLGLIAIPVGAKLIPGESSDKIIAFYYDHFKIDLRNNVPEPSNNNPEDIVNTLILESLDQLVLPQALLGDEYSKSVVSQEDDLMTTIYVDFSNESTGISGSIMISQYKDENFLGAGSGNMPGDHKYFKQIKVEELDVLIFGYDERIYIKYLDNNTEYEIFINCDFDTAVKIAESIK